MAEESGKGVWEVVGLAGSLRAASWNRKLLHATAALAPASLRITPAGIGEIPLYNADLDDETRLPEPVRLLRESVSAADGLLIVSPEYNHSVPGVLQNAIDWLSRPSMRSPLAGKPVAIMGASNGLVGTARMQQVLKLTLVSTLALVMPHPGVVVSRVSEKFDAEGRLTDDATRKFIGTFLDQFSGWIATHRS